jgi:flagellar biogenesis protein FliO
VVSVVASLIVILGFLLAGAFLARRWRVGGRIRGNGGAAAITIVAAQAVGWQSSLQIVEADGQRFLIAAGRAGITAIGRLPPAQYDRQPRPDA